MQSNRPSQNEMQPELERPSHESDRIDNALLVMSTRLGRAVSADRVAQWHKDFSPYPIQAIEYALDSWGRNGKMMPALSELLGLLRTYTAEHVFFELCGKCDTGWVRDGSKDKAGNEAVRRCECVSR